MASIGSPSAPVAIKMLPAAAATDAGVIAELTDLVNRVYACAEEGIWVDGATRTTTAEMAEMIAADQVAVARMEGAVVGAVRIQQLSDTKGELGMLAADPAHRHQGIGRELVVFAEELSRRRGMDVMQLELLVPRDWKHPTKEFLDAWYRRIGYRPVQTGRIDDSYPHLAPLLATPCDFVIYHKALAH
jgi:GNAT superfamily N-acetyltransferase